MNVTLLIVIVYIMLLYGLAWYSTKLKSGEEIVEEFFLADRGFPAYIVAAMLTGLAVGGASTIGVAESAYTQGISAGMYNAAWAVGAIVVGFTAASRLRDLTVTTIPELFGNYYDEAGRVIAVIGQIIIQIVITSLQYIAGGAILASLLPELFSVNMGALLTAIVLGGVALIGGYWGAGLTNLINVIVIYIGVIIGAIMSISKAGGISNIVANLPVGLQWFDPVAGVGIGIIIAWFIVMITQTHSTQAVVQISFAAKDGQTAKRGFILGGLIILPIGFICALFGIVAAVQFPGLEDPAMALPKVILNLPAIISGLTLAGLWASSISTTVGLLLGSSTLVVNDIWKNYIQTDITQKQEHIMSRIVVVVITALTFLLAITVEGILDTLLIGLTLTTAYTVVVLFTIFAPKLCKKSAAFWTIGTGIIFLFVWVFVPAIRIVSHPIFLAWPIAIGTFLLVSMLDKTPANIPNEVVESEST
ncbi:sodium:solute symporter family protein [Acetohalobium arabaticum]|uniref:Na+/solute symporter n=1 Tax=Acetohalobium arabaticum (strain ATCC 49924 / DSM 5501 / Z-7288) TaxID=574087 RepID=D9QS76_ACEAZ|nr:sodium:solute symporter family protein [Acetohalobium arabaticum]ADL13367.1 Na+/solute symporter [Acetohalobium arabaticum DSM 5501]